MPDLILMAGFIGAGLGFGIGLVVLCAIGLRRDRKWQRTHRVGRFRSVS